MERMQSKEKTSEKITCSLVVLPLDTNTMWKPVSPDTGNTSNPIIIMSINLCQQSRIQQVSISLSWLVSLSFNIQIQIKVTNYLLKAGYIYTSTLYFWNFSTLWISWIYVTGGEKQDSKATRSQGLWHTVTTVKPLSPHTDWH